ncbi:hypothetical protein T02_12503 [Trichinella nativa]|uniref:Uncharacterized protein n=1 Tax=Trichinella nativa TaxID=6335 RepID=A0A0V1LN63_9BILA|nr:hypothetical protein T02_12503 [Trichinella nativa]
MLQADAFSQMDNSLLDPDSEPFDIVQLLFTLNNGNENYGANRAYAVLEQDNEHTHNGVNLR